MHIKIPQFNKAKMNKRTCHALGLALISLTLMSFPPVAYSLTECEFFERRMNTLGSRMARLRLTIASTEDSSKQNLSSEQLKQYENDYRITKRQYDNANCEEIWDRE